MELSILSNPVKVRFRPCGVQSASMILSQWDSRDFTAEIFPQKFANSDNFAKSFRNSRASANAFTTKLCPISLDESREANFFKSWNEKILKFQVYLSLSGVE